ncbi:MAG: acetyl-CoA carboxylase carboxyl transferase subunit alpha, partial [Pseudomonadales bacterium]|nr:acetyl-CoA carboxylase carboxyl transferase subunit alpha [Pseudomonadales bacterium]
LLMLKFSTYSVISPEGCASILWKSAEHAPLAAEAMGLTASRLYELGLVDRVIEEPLGGAHRDHDQTAQSIKSALIQAIDRLSGKPVDQLLDERYKRLMSMGYSG